MWREIERVGPSPLANGSASREGGEEEGRRGGEEEGRRGGEEEGRRRGVGCGRNGGSASEIGKRDPSFGDPHAMHRGMSEGLLKVQCEHTHCWVWETSGGSVLFTNTFDNQPFLVAGCELLVRSNRQHWQVVKVSLLTSEHFGHSHSAELGNIRTTPLPGRGIVCSYSY